jgi:hypothetical protein
VDEILRQQLKDIVSRTLGEDFFKQRAQKKKGTSRAKPAGRGGRSKKRKSDVFEADLLEAARAESKKADAPSS